MAPSTPPKSKMIVIGAVLVALGVLGLIAGLLLPAPATPDENARAAMLTYQIAGAFGGVGVVFVLIGKFKNPDTKAFPSDHDDV